MRKAKIISNGTVKGTHLLVDGEELENLEWVRWEARGEDKSINCEFRLADCPAIVEGYVIEERPPEDWYCPRCREFVHGIAATHQELHERCSTAVISGEAGLVFERAMKEMEASG